jgi:replication factor A1
LKLNEVEAGKNISDLVVRVMSVQPARMVQTRSGRKTQLVEVLVGDETGTAILSLWGFKEGQGVSGEKVIRIKDGWAKEWQGKVQLSLGRSGTLEEVEDDGTVPTSRKILEDNKEAPE